MAYTQVTSITCIQLSSLLVHGTVHIHDSNSCHAFKNHTHIVTTITSFTDALVPAVHIRSHIPMDVGGGFAPEK